MKANEIKVGGLYRAKVAGRLTTVRVDEIRPDWSINPIYHVTNLATGRRTTFRSAAKFRGEVKDATPPKPRYSRDDPNGQGAYDATINAKQRSGAGADPASPSGDGRGVPARPNAGPTAATGPGPVVEVEVGGCYECGRASDLVVYPHFAAYNASGERPRKSICGSCAAGLVDSNRAERVSPFAIVRTI